MPRLAPTRQCHRKHDSTASSPGQATPSRLAQDVELILHATRGRVRFNKDHCPPCADQRRKSLFSLYFIIFSLPNTYMQIIPDVTLAWSSAATSCHDQHRLASAIASMTQQQHHDMANVASATTSPA
jgi:hypothetical protein